MHELNPQQAAGLIAAASDLALVINAKGVIKEVRLSADDLPFNDYPKWVGQPWASTVTTESRVKVEDMLKDAGLTGKRKWRQINYPSAQGADVPMLCSAIAVGNEGEIIAFGRDMRATASLQQRLMQSHQSMERDYLRMRHMETRYRLLFELASEAVLIVDTQSNKVVEANPAAAKILDVQAKRMIGRPLVECLDPSHKTLVDDLLNSVRNTGNLESRKMPWAKDGGDMMISASIFKQETGALFLVRLTPSALHSSVQVLMPRRSMLLEVLEHSPDGFVVTDANGKILTSNQAFVEMAQMMRPDQVVGQPLETWLGRSDVDLRVLIANIQQRGSVRLFATTLRGSNGADLQVEISGVATADSQRPCLGFSIRDIGHRTGADREPLQELPRSADQLVDLVGRVPLQEIVSETADLIEKLCIEAALKLTRDNRASAAEMLGLSRQSLYVKLRRYSIGEVSDRNKK